MAQVKTAIGLMSGTSIDGIDAAILSTDGADHLELGPAIDRPYPAEVRAAVQAATRCALEGRNDDTSIAEAARLVTLAQAKIVAELIAEAKLTPADIDVIGFHGQTILHKPPEGGALCAGLSRGACAPAGCREARRRAQSRGRLQYHLYPGVGRRGGDDRL